MNRSFHPDHSTWRLSFLAVIVLSMTGCDFPERPPLSRIDDQPHSLQSADDLAVADATEIVEPPGKRFTGSWEKWDSFFIRNRPAGSMHLAADNVGGVNRGEVRYDLNNRLIVRRGTSTMIQRFTHRSTETDDGRLLGFEASLHVGPAVTHFIGSVRDGMLTVTRLRGTEQTTVELPWKKTYRGLVAIEQSLRRQPMVEGETRTLKMPMLMAAGFRIVTVRLRSTGKASVPMIGGSPRTLTEISSQVVADGETIESVLWCDDSGNVLRSYAPGIRMIGYRSDEAVATKDMASFDETTRSLAFEVKGELNQPEKLRRVAFKLSPTAALKRAGEKILFAPAPGQYVRALDDGTVNVLVSVQDAVAPKDFVGEQLLPTAGDSAIGDVIDSDAPYFRKIVDISLAGQERTERETALELTASARTIFKKRASLFPGFSPASELGESGDSTQHAVVLAALLRARKIPARLASGLVYVAGEPPHLSYHTWTLAFVDGSWLALDAMTGTLAPPDRLTFGTTDLSAGNEYAAIDPILAALGRFDIAIVGSQ